MSNHLMNDITKSVMGIITSSDDSTTKENANKDAKLVPTQRDLVAGTVSKAIALDSILPKHIANAHTVGDIHFHDLDYSPLFPMFNCFSRDTDFITIDGIKSFNDYEDGSVVYVPSHTGQIRKAVVRCYGEQQLNKITFKRARGFRTVKATANHRWLLKNNEETTSLKVGDKILPPPVMIDGEFDDLSFCLGFGYGDGTMNNGYFRIPLFGRKNEYAEIFKRAGFSVTTPPYRNGETNVILNGYTKGLPHTFPSELNIDIRSFCLGLAAADATADKRNIVATGEEATTFIREHFDTAGLYIGGEQDLTGRETNFGVRKKKTVMFNITRPDHYYWKVNAIEEYTVEDVWCLEVEEDHSFILRGGIVTGNCMLIDYEGMLKYGFKMGSADIDTPKSITTACAVVAQITASVASNIYGGNTLSRIDEILAPYVTASAKKHHDRGERYGLTAHQLEKYVKECTEKECFDAFQALEYEINTLQTSNGQTPFTTINFGLGTSWESRMIQEAILKNRIRGLGKNGETPAFPKLVFTIKKGVNFSPEDPNYSIKKLAIECSVKRMYPDIINYDKIVEITGDFKPPMGCRSFLGSYQDEKGDFVTLGRNNLGVVTVNLPRLAIRANGSVEEFYRLLDEQLQICFEALMLRIERLSTVKAKTAPILYTQGACGVRLDPEESITKLFENGRASISLGYIGIHETVCSLFGSDKVFGKYEKEAEKIVEYLRSTVEMWKRNTSWGFSLYSTPAESLCYRFCRLDREQYGVIDNVTDKEYYTNSFHLDVREKVSAFDKIEFEMAYPKHASGGFITFWESNSLINNPEALETVWDFTYDRVPYFASNFPTDTCFECDFKGEFTASVEGYCCPKCGNTNPDRMDVTRRVCGYLGKAGRPFNHGKQVEVIKRVKHM